MERAIGDPNKAKEILKEYGESAPGWPYAEKKKYLDNLAGVIKRELIDPIALVSRVEVPDVLVGFDDAGNKGVLAYYRNIPNAHGIPDEVIMNTAHYTEVEAKIEWRWGLWSEAEVLTHEMVHGLFNFISKVENRKIPAHGVEFVLMCKKIGLNVLPVVGSHFQVADKGSPFDRVMKEMGIARPQDVPRSDNDPLPKTDYFRPKKEKGKSTLNKWECPSCGFKVRVGVKDDPQLIHKPCGEMLIYKA